MSGTGSWFFWPTRFLKTPTDPSSEQSLAHLAQGSVRTTLDRANLTEEVVKMTGRILMWVLVAIVALCAYNGAHEQAQAWSAHLGGCLDRLGATSTSLCG